MIQVFSCGADERTDVPTEGSTRGPRGPKKSSNGVMDKLNFFVDLKVFDDVRGAPDKDVQDSNGHLPISGGVWLTNKEW